jgi:hypothetical protein
MIIRGLAINPTVARMIIRGAGDKPNRSRMIIRELAINPTVARMIIRGAGDKPNRSRMIIRGSWRYSGIPGDYGGGG